MFRKLTKEQIKNYKEENKFVEKIIIPLFNLIAKYRRFSDNGPVKIENWGKDKRSEGNTGIDVYFGFYDEFNKENHYGIQAKITKIICRSKGGIPNSIETISNQIRKAYDAEFTNPLSPKEPAKISGFYIITSQQIDITARNYFKNLGYPNIEILDVDDLLYAIRKLSKYEND